MFCSWPARGHDRLESQRAYPVHLKFRLAYKPMQIPFHYKQMVSFRGQRYDEDVCKQGRLRVLMTPAAMGSCRVCSSGHPHTDTLERALCSQHSTAP